MSLTKRQIKRIARIWAGSALVLDQGDNSAEESGITQEELSLIQEEFIAIGQRLLRDDDAVSWFPDIVRLVQKGVKK